MDYAQSIRATIEQATAEHWQDGTDWYHTAHTTAERFAAEYGTDTDTVARMVAVLSPRKRWSENVKATQTILAAWSAGQGMPSIPGVFGANIVKAWRIVNGEPDALSGPKVTRFYANIMGDDTEVTVDVWAMRAAGVTDHDAPTITEYHAIADAYRTVASEHGIPASTLQAVAWTVIRGKAA